MADAVLDLKITNCEEECEELKTNLRAVEDTLDIHSGQLRGLELWRNGNGARGAESRLQSIEKCIRELEDVDAGKRINVLESDVRIVQNISDASIQSNVATVLRDRDKTAIAKIKAWAPIVTAGLVFIATLVQIILGRVL